MLADNLVSAVALIDEHGEFSIINKAFLRMFDLDEEADILNVNSQDWKQWRVFDENGRPLDVDEHPVRKAVLTRTAVKDTLVAMQSPVSPDLKWLLVSAEPILDSHGKAQQIICTYHDITERRRAEEALRASEERLRLLGDNLPDSTVYQYTCEPDGTPRFLHISAGVERLNGVKAEDVLQDAGVLHRQFLPSELPAFLEAERLSARDRSVFERELRMRLPDGQLRWMHLRSRPRRLPDGRVTWDGVQTDITERKQAEEALRQRAEEVERLLEVVPVAVWVASDPQCLTITGNRRANEFYEASTGENVSATAVPEARQFFAPDGRELAASELPMQVAAAVNHDVRDVELHVQIASGRRIAMLGSAAPLRNEIGEVRGCIGAFMDITERRTVEAELEKHRHHLEELVRERTAELESANAQLQATITERELAQAAFRESESAFATLANFVPQMVWMCTPDGLNARLQSALGVVHPG